MTKEKHVTKDKKSTKPASLQQTINYLGEQVGQAMQLINQNNKIKFVLLAIDSEKEEGAVTGNIVDIQDAVETMTTVIEYYNKAASE